MSRLKELLENTELFEVVSASSDPVEQCIGRAADNKLWIDLISDILRIEKHALDEGYIKSNLFGVSKFYYVTPAGGIAYMWKVVCVDVGWLEANFPKINKATWAKNFQVTMAPDGMPDKVTLVSTTGKAKLPHPKDFGLSDGSSGVTSSD